MEKDQGDLVKGMVPGLQDPGIEEADGDTYGFWIGWFAYQRNSHRQVLLFFFFCYL
jgi:hypothetical protein